MPVDTIDLIPSRKKIMIVAGEASGDMHGASLVQEMLKINPALTFYGIGGGRMRDAGVKLMVDAAEMAVVGLTEVLAKLGHFLAIMKQMKKSLAESKPDLLILIDYPGFNLSLAKAAHKKGIKVFYYISPQVWAWRKGRIKQIKNIVDKMAVILPFEVDVYRQEGFHVDYVGHPLLDLVKTDYPRNEALKLFGLAPNKTTIGLLPGSRNSEVMKLLPEMLRAAEILLKEIPDLQFVLPLAETLEEKIIHDVLAKYKVKVTVIAGHTYDVISCADLAVVASGTATLETALLGIPMIIIYKASPLSFFIGKMIVNINNIGLVNIIAGKTIVPELLQNEAEGIHIAAEVLTILKNPQRKQEIISDLGAIRAKLGNPGGALRAAKLACDML